MDSKLYRQAVAVGWLIAIAILTLCYYIVLAA